MKDGASAMMMARSGGHKDILTVVKAKMLFWGQYQFISRLPEHKSDTCIVLVAMDSNNNSKVALKLMKHRVNFEAEMSCRSSLDSQYVIGVLTSFEGDKDPLFRSELINKGFSEYYFCIVMPAASRNLQQILNQENIVAKEWDQIRDIFKTLVTCTNYLHSKGVIHGDVKPLNIMRSSDGKILLIDLDASVKIGDAISVKCSPAYCPPELVRVDIDTNAVSMGPLIAVEAFDMWALGCVLFEMCSGQHLFLVQPLNCVQLK